jgi:beta-lactamase superfamily II metal-dependent hydrolase
MIKKDYKMRAIFNFHNVGQGLFYSGHINCDDNTRFNFVYDCGAVNKTASDRSPTLDTAITRLHSYLEEGAIDLLVISHLHEDHINGIPKLLVYKKKKKLVKRKVKNIFIPYFTFEERLILLLENGLQLTDEQIKLTLNPYAYLASSDNDVENIFIIKHKKNDDGIKDNDINFENIHEQDSDSNHSVYSELDNNQKSKVFVLDDAKAISVYSKPDGTATNKTKCWRFAFYADNSKVPKLAPYFRNKAQDKIDKLKKETNFTNIKKILDDLRQLYKPTGKLNETSLIMAHKCIQDIEMRYIYPQHHHYHNNHNHPYWWHCCRHHGSFVHIMTGDFEFIPKKLTSVKKHFGKFLDSECRILQVPHHGSKENWDNGLINSGYTLCVIPFGVQNQHGHPSIEVKNDILSKHNTCLHEVTESQSLMLGFDL